MAESKLNFKEMIRMAFTDVKATSEPNRPDLQSSEEPEKTCFASSEKIHGAVAAEVAKISNEFEEQGSPLDVNSDPAALNLESLHITDSKQETADSTSHFEDLDSSTDFEHFKKTCEALKQEELSALQDISEKKTPKDVPACNKVFKEILNEKVVSTTESTQNASLSQSSNVSPKHCDNDSKMKPQRSRRQQMDRARDYSRYDDDDSQKGARGSRPQQMDRAPDHPHYDNGCRRRPRGSSHHYMERLHDYSHYNDGSKRRPQESRHRYMDRGRDYSHQEDCSKKRTRGSRQQQRGRPDHCSGTGVDYLDRLRDFNHYAEYKLNDFDGSGVDCFKNGGIAREFASNKVVRGNRVYYFATPKNRILEGFVADSLKPENKKPVKLTEEQIAALEPDEYWEV